MRRTTRLGVVAAIGGAALVAAAGPATAGGLDLGLAHKQESGWTADHLQGKPIEPGKARNFYLRVANPGSSTTTVVVDDLETPSPEYRAKYFRKQRNVTTALHGTGHELTVKAGKAKVIRARIKARAGGGAPPACLVLRAAHDDEHYATVSLNGGCA